MADSVFNSLGQEIPGAKLVGSEPSTVDGYGYIPGRVVKPEPGYGTFDAGNVFLKTLPKPIMPPPPVYPTYPY